MIEEGGNILIMKERFLLFINSLSDIFVGGFCSFYLAKLIKPSYLEGYNTFKESPMFWYFSYRAHSETAISILVRIYEKRPKGRADQLTFYKFLDFLKQNCMNIFSPSLQETIKKHIREDLIRLGQEDEIIKKLNNLRDKVLGHFDISVLKDPEKQFYLENEIGDDELERLFKLAENILMFYSLAFNCSIVVNSKILEEMANREFTYFKK